MPEASDVREDVLKARILTLLDDHRVMSVATNRADGWPQATMVGFVHDDLSLYFVVARISQKLANIVRDPRVSIALGHDSADRIQGLSMAAHAAEVVGAADVEHLNRLMRDRYPEQARFWPREASSAVIRAWPSVISIIDLSRAPGEPEMLAVGDPPSVHRVSNLAADRAAFGRGPGMEPDGAVVVHSVISGRDGYRPGAPL